MPQALALWTPEPVPIIGCALAALLYWLGTRTTSAPTHAKRISFSAGLCVLLLSLVSPVDALDGSYQWVHMLQHVLLLVVAPPLILLGDPFVTAWAGLRSLRPALPSQPPGARILARLCHDGTRSAVAITLLFVLDLFAWHVPQLYNLTLQNDSVHDVEHTLFLVTGLLFWDQVITSAPRAAGTWARATLLLVAMVTSWALAVVIGYATHPLYAYPVHADLSGLADQQIAAGIMWVPASIPFVVALGVLAARWFESDDLAAAATRVR